MTGLVILKCYTYVQNMYIFLVKSEVINCNTEFELIYGKYLNLLKISSPKNENVLSKL